MERGTDGNPDVNEKDSIVLSSSFYLDGRRKAIDWTDIVKSLENVTHVHFRNVKCGADELEMIDNSIKRNTILSLKLECADIETKEIDQLLTLLSNQRKTLKELSLPKNRITSSDLTILAEWINHCGDELVLETINLSGNIISDYNMDILCESLEEIHTLSELSLFSNNLSEGGCRCIADLLSSSHGLRVLDLWNNKLGAIGIAQLCRVFTDNSFHVQIVCSVNGCDRIRRKTN